MEEEQLRKLLEAKRIAHNRLSISSEAVTIAVVDALNDAELDKVGGGVTIMLEGGKP
ncbi:MAG: hypothetical protein H0V81_10850 [Solirubrobacterales bacterium]|nr:hypothetical protein [Solirubrobacterales bacterium]